MEQRRYCAFISYRHYTPDKEVAQRLHSLIENYTIPSALRGEGGLKHPGRVFSRDMLYHQTNIHNHHPIHNLQE